jgi:lysine 2,3-aminomutase
LIRLPNHSSPAHRVRYVSDTESLSDVPPHERAGLGEVSARYAFRANDYYLSLIDWNDPADPIRRLIVPDAAELDDWGRLDPSNEAAHTVARGVQHKYTHTVLLLCNEVCGGYCRYCFRKRLFMDGNSEAARDLSEGVRYISEHPEVTNVLLTGGDPLLLATRRLAALLEALRAIPHVRIIRIGSKMPAFNPWRLLDDPDLLALLRKHSEPRRRIYLMAHFDHPRELTDPAVRAIDACINHGVICVNQCPLIRGVNDDPDVLSDLYRELSFIGCSPYYLFQGRPTAGNRPYQVPIVRGWDIFRETIRRGSGLARRPRFVMSHATGKIEIVGVDARYIYLRYHRSQNLAEQGRLLVYHRDDTAFWLDDLEPAARPSRDVVCLAESTTWGAALAENADETVAEL